MAEVKKKFSELDPGSVPFEGTETIAAVQGGITKRGTISGIHGAGWWDKLKAAFVDFVAPEALHANDADTSGGETSAELHNAGALTGTAPLSAIPAQLTGKNAATATSAAKLTNARTITLTGNATGSTSFDGSGNVSISVTVGYASAAGSAGYATSAGTSGACSGNAATASKATKLTNARTINGVLFDGSANITVADSTKAPLASPALTGTPTAPTPATATNNTQIATTAFVKNQKYEPNRGTGDYSTALGASSNASGVSSTALGVLSKASGVYSTALGRASNASGDFSTALGYGANASRDFSTALGYGAVADRDHQITIGTKFVYFRFASTETEATVYNALSPWLNPAAGNAQGAMGSSASYNPVNGEWFHFSVTHLTRAASTTISLRGIANDAAGGSGVKNIRSGEPTPIGSNLAICTVRY